MEKVNLVRRAPSNLSFIFLEGICRDELCCNLRPSSSDRKFKCVAK